MVHGCRHLTLAGMLRDNREDAYSRTGGIFIRDTAYSL